MNSASVKGGGSDSLGIDLSTLKRAAEAWESRVWVESSEGDGSAFHFTVLSSQQA